MIRNGSWLVLLSLLLYPIISSSQEKTSAPGVFTDSFDVTVANIEVFVTTKRGVPITGLEREDFTLLVDGKEVEIVNFAAIEKGELVYEPRPASAQPEAAPAPQQERVEPAPQPLHVAVFIDTLFARGSNLRLIIPEVQDFLRSKLPSNAQVMLVTFTGRVNTLVPFTTDVSRVVTALEQLRKLTTQGTLIDNQAMQTLTRLEADKNLLAGSSLDGQPTYSDQELDDATLTELRAQAEEIHMLARRSWRGLQLVIDSFSSIGSGRKVVLHVSEGIPLRPNVAALQQINPSTMPATTRRELERVVNHANANGVTVYALYLGGFEARPGIATADVPGWAMYSNPDRIRLMNHTKDADDFSALHLVSSLTGGTAVARPTAKTLSPIAQDLSTAYSLGFRPDPEKLGLIQRIEVKVAKSKAQVRYRRTHWQASREEHLIAPAYSALTVDAFGNPLEVSWEAEPATSTDTDQMNVPIVVRVPADRLTFLPSSGEQQSNVLRLYLVSRNDREKISPMKLFRLPINLTQAIDFSKELPIINYRAELLLKPGTHDVAITAYDEVAKIAATRCGSVTVTGDGSVTSELR